MDKIKLACILLSGSHAGIFPLKMDKILGFHLATNTPYLGGVELVTIQPANKTYTHRHTPLIFAEIAENYVKRN